MLSAEPSVQEVLHNLYRNHHGWLKGWLRKKLGCGEQAADIAQDTFVRVIVSGRTPQADESRAHLTQIAKGLVIDLYRRRSIEQSYHEALMHLPEAEMPSAETQAIVLETLVRINIALDSLPTKVREVFLLSQFEGLTYTQISEKLAISVGAVRKYMLKAAQACFNELGS